MEEHRGHIEIGKTSFGAALRQMGDRLYLDIYETDGGFGASSPENIEIGLFRSATGYFTLVGLERSGARAMLGVGGTATYSVRLAYEGANFSSPTDIVSDTWIAYIQDVAAVLHVTGLGESITFNDERVTLNWTFKPPKPVTLDCPVAGLKIELGQDMKTAGDPVVGRSLNFRYPVIIRFPSPVDIEVAWTTITKARRFFSLMMGRVLDLDETALRIIDDGHRHDIRVHGLRAAQRSERPADKIVAFDGPADLARLLDRWLALADSLSDAANLHFQGLEHGDLALPLQFQLFVQAIEASHRRTVAATGKPIDAKPVLEALQDKGVPKDVRDRVAGILAHSHEPALRKRLKDYWSVFAAEISVLRPDAKRDSTIEKITATRNFYAHRMDKSASVLEGGALWDAIELLKAISHLALLKEIDAQIDGVGAAMLQERFVRFALPRS